MVRQVRRCGLVTSYAEIEMNWSDIYVKAWPTGAVSPWLLKPATVLISAGVDRAKGRKLASEMGD